MKGEKEFFRKRFFGGFNRNDVIKYIAKIAEERNAAIAAKEKAEKELRELTVEVEKLRKENSASEKFVSKPDINVSSEESIVKEEPEAVKMQADIIDYSELKEAVDVRENEGAKEIAEIDNDIAAIKEIGQIKEEIPEETPTPEPVQEESPPESSPSEPVKYAAPSEPVWRAVPVTQAPEDETPPEPFLYAGTPDPYWFADPNEPTPEESPPEPSVPEPIPEEPAQEEPPAPEPVPEEPAQEEPPAPEPANEEPTQEEPPVPEPTPEEPPAPESPPPEPPPVEEEKTKTARVKIKIRKIQ